MPLQLQKDISILDCLLKPAIACWRVARLGQKLIWRVGPTPTSSLARSLTAAPCSAQALRKQVLKDGTLPTINPVVDLYNAVSLKYAIPVGGENHDAYVGRPFLTIADGTETFDTLMNGEAVDDPPLLGEVIWRDDIGVTCRRWNWRQGTRTRLEAATARIWFILEALETMPDEALAEATDALVEGLNALMPGYRIVSQAIAITK
ncbi:hypothetical protein MES4922_10097 [Mesorhizobium ventifaucium]|uniref:B3/B4 tRNA-binding domain-containing protein n=1 Tax=Mesorhizobium ventifaucium TaxID=666020 RepID=A0ABM9DCE1_9HYPH|nr:hypothetical protein MES4922_10097 [Mesorhizobium ventifaucium]